MSRKEQDYYFSVAKIAFGQSKVANDLTWKRKEFISSMGSSYIISVAGFSSKYIQNSVVGIEHSVISPFSGATVVIRFKLFKR